VRWLDAEQTAATLDKLRPGQRKPRQGGAFAIQVTGRDPWAAVEAANELIARVSARVQVGRPGSDLVRTAGVAYVTGNGREFQLRPPRRQLDVHALHRQGAVFDVDPADSRQLDDALELAAYLETGSAGAAVTGGWAAIEGLLLHAGERGHVAAADRLAAIVACSVGRAELTPLAFAHQAHGSDDLASQLQAMDVTSSNYERVRLTEQHLRDGHRLALASASDEAALDRVTGILGNARADIGRIRQYVQDTFGASTTSETSSCTAARSGRSPCRPPYEPRHRSSVPASIGSFMPSLAHGSQWTPCRSAPAPKPSSTCSDPMAHRGSSTCWAGDTGRRAVGAWGRPVIVPGCKPATSHPSWTSPWTPADAGPPADRQGFGFASGVGVGARACETSSAAASSAPGMTWA
jgi:hypothetical protein